MFSFFNDLFHGTPHQHLKNNPVSTLPNIPITNEHSQVSQSSCTATGKRLENRKRLRETGAIVADAQGVGHGKHCVISTDGSSVEVCLEPPAKKVRSVIKEESKLVQMVPTEVLHHVLAFCGSTQDRFAIQTTCKTFQRISNDSPELLANVSLGGDVNGKGGLLRDEDTPATASIKLTPYCQAGNLEAIYMLGMIKSYCLHDVDKGISLLKLASKRGYIRATYTLGIMLRDIKPREARRYMSEAAELGYLPALQEILPARDLKTKFGEPTAGELCQYLDPTSLNRLLGRHYVICPHLRDLNTSHCWNPLCGRWAHRAQNASIALNASNMTSTGRNRRPFTLSKDQAPNTPGAMSNTRVSRMKMCSRCCRAKYCSKLCQVYDWRSGRHKVECPFL